MSNPTQAQGPATQQRRARWLWQAPRAQSLRIAPRLARLELLIALATLAPWMTACRPTATGNASPTRTLSDGSFRWTLTRLEGATPETQVGWLDNDTVLFIGSNESSDGSPQISGLYAWNRKSPARLVLANAYQFCFDGETWTARTGEPQPGRDDLLYRRYQINQKDLSTTWIGPDRAGASTGYPNPYTCRDEEVPARLTNRHWASLRPRDGFLDFGPIGSLNQEAFIISPDLTSRTPLGLTTKYPTGQITKFSEPAGAYLVYDITFSPDTLARWNREKKFPIHIITPKGLAHQINASPGPWSEQSGGDRSIAITRSGLGISSKGGYYLHNSISGVYILRPNKTFTKLDNGIIESLSASPDGCALAYTQAIRSPITSLKTATLCSPHKTNETKQPPSP